MDHRAALLRFLYHVGLVAAVDVNDARQQAARLSVYLDRYRLARLEPGVPALCQPDTAVRTYLKPGLQHRIHPQRRTFNQQEFCR